MNTKTDLKSKPSLLSLEQVLRLNSLFLSLILFRLGMGPYRFASDDLQRYSVIGCVLLFFLVIVVVFLGPQGRARTVILILAIPVIPFLACGCYLTATGYDEYPSAVLSSNRVGNVVFELIASYDVTYDPICRQFITLQMERPIFNGVLTEVHPLVDVEPGADAVVLLIDGGKHLRLRSPALLGRKEVVRVISTNWDEASKSACEHIVLTSAEQAESIPSAGRH